MVMLAEKRQFHPDCSKEEFNYKEEVQQGNIFTQLMDCSNVKYFKCDYNYVVTNLKFHIRAYHFLSWPLVTGGRDGGATEKTDILPN